MEIRNLLRQQSQGGWEDFEENDQWTRAAACVCVWLQDLPSAEVREVLCHCFSFCNSRPTGVYKFTDNVTWRRLLYIYIEKIEQDWELHDSYFAFTVWCILIIGCSVPSIWSLDLSEAAVCRNFSLCLPPLHSDLSSRRLLIARPPAPRLLLLSTQLSLPAVTGVQSPLASPSPLSSHPELRPASLFRRPLLHLCGVLIIRLGFSSW